MRKVWAFAAACAASLWLAGCGGSSGGGSSTSAPELGVYAGVVLDEDGHPVAGALVSIDGIAAEAVTGADGSYRIEHPDLVAPAASLSGAASGANQQIKVAVVAPGFDPLAQDREVASGERADLRVFRAATEPELLISSPTGERTFVVPDGCSEPHVVVEGYARLRTVSGYRLDVVVVIDRSGSTRKAAFDVDGDGVAESVLEVELEAARGFFAGLDPSVTRAAVVSFEDSAVVDAAFTRDFGAAGEALSAVGPPEHGTNYEAAFTKAAELLEELAAEDEDAEVPAEDPANAVPPPVKAVLFLSDGIPTSHGIPRDGSDTNLTQSRDDRLAAISGAERLGTTGAQLFAFSVIPADDDRRRTTLPHCVAACGGGRYVNLVDATLLIDEVRGKPLDARLRVELRNLTTGERPLKAALYPDGFFSERVAVSPAVATGVGTNEIEVILTARLGPEEKVASRALTVRCVSEDALLGVDDLATLQSAEREVADVAYLRRPTGGALSDSDLHDFLRSEFEDAVELYGVDTFFLPTPVSGSSVRLDYVFKDACYRSDVGFLYLDPASPPRSAEEALAGVSDSQILFNSGEGDLAACTYGSVEPGRVTREVQVPDGGAVAFFILPNRTLAEYRADPMGGPDPLFTVPGLNPGGHDQVLTFRSLRGRTAPGPSRSVVLEGPVLVFAFEDLTIAKKSDQDFSDVVFTLSGVAGRIDALECDP